MSIREGCHFQIHWFRSRLCVDKGYSVKHYDDSIRFYVHQFCINWAMQKKRSRQRTLLLKISRFHLSFRSRNGPVNAEIGSETKMISSYALWTLVKWVGIPTFQTSLKILFKQYILFINLSVSLYPFWENLYKYSAPKAFEQWWSFVLPVPLFTRTLKMYEETVTSMTM